MVKIEIPNYYFFHIGGSYSHILMSQFLKKVHSTYILSTQVQYIPKLQYPSSTQSCKNKHKKLTLHVFRRKNKIPALVKSILRNSLVVSLNKSASRLNQAVKELATCTRCLTKLRTVAPTILYAPVHPYSDPQFIILTAH